MNNKKLVDKDTIDKIQVKLKGLKLMTDDKEIISTIDEVLALLQNEAKTKDVSIKEMIIAKMRETKSTNPELNFRLYILNRKLEKGVMSEEEALKAYEIYISL